MIDSANNWSPCRKRRPRPPNRLMPIPVISRRLRRLPACCWIRNKLGTRSRPRRGSARPRCFPAIPLAGSFMQLVRSIPQRGDHRRGLTTPVVAIALMITMAGMALILDRIWLETAQLELTTAAEATALAAARQLAADDRLVPNIDSVQRLDAARTAAEALAAGNLVAGQLPSFSVAGTDILFGNYTELQENGSIQFDTTVTDPLSVRITLHRSRARSNPVALFVGQLTGIPFGNVVRQADATVNNHIAVIRPVSGGFAPGLPLAIWKNDPSGNRNDTWDVQIEQRKGSDNYRYDLASRKPAPGSDGIPEIAVRSLARGGRPELCNLQVLDIGTDFADA